MSVRGHGLDKSEISRRFESSLSRQTYEKSNNISDVKLIDFFTDDSGDFHEPVRIEGKTDQWHLPWDILGDEFWEVSRG